MGVGTLIIAELPRQWDHPERYCYEPAPAVLVSRAQTSPTQMGSTAVGAAVPRTASRSICQRGGPTSASAIVLDAYSQYSTPTSWDCGDLSCNARTILPGCFRMRAMSQQLFFATVCGTKKLDRALPNSQNFWWSEPSRKICVRYPHVPLELSLLDAAYSGLQSLQREKLCL